MIGFFFFPYQLPPPALANGVSRLTDKVWSQKQFYRQC
jgi:hypothetical protein